MIASVSTLARSSGATSPSSRMNFSMCLAEASDIDEMACDRSRGSHDRADEMRPAALPLASFEIAVRSRRAAVSRQKLVVVHAEAHRAARLAPFETGCGEDLVEAFLLRLL